ncbi:YHYH protein [Endozoicomonas elysicola]|uniref:YHYH domain-containing protein n=1 Tax=Endozoicomonas elysicola TaxID=305900 RepID=A0A081KBX2_9GAMM|nr:YHYH protein [Endozoicomonas elysicola]KEI71648.1 hypothetical protein GV64_13680 [Endozoicomonas elysicola]
MPVTTRWNSLLLSVILTQLPSAGWAHNNAVTITIDNGKRCVISNGLPDHDTGRFPNPGNPNSITEQDVRLCFSKVPHKGSIPQSVRGSIGVAINGVQIRPGTAEYYDASSPRGFSRDRSSGWNLEGIGARDRLGMDQNNAHVDQRGLYHYHGIPEVLVETVDSTLIGYAADGFEIHYAYEQQTSSYQLKPGNRPAPPGGLYDGTYNQDWEYQVGSGTLDECNGGTLEGAFVYYATDTYPFYPRCLWGEISTDFLHKNSNRESRRNQDSQRRSRKPAAPQEAINACYGKQSDDYCQFRTPGRGQRVTGTCRRTPAQNLACIPARRH